MQQYSHTLRLHLSVLTSRGGCTHPSPSKWIFVSLQRGRTIPIEQLLLWGQKKQTKKQQQCYQTDFSLHISLMNIGICTFCPVYSCSAKTCLTFKSQSHPLPLFLFVPALRYFRTNFVYSVSQNIN